MQDVHERLLELEDTEQDRLDDDAQNRCPEGAAPPDGDDAHQLDPNLESEIALELRDLTQRRATSTMPSIITMDCLTRN